MTRCPERRVLERFVAGSASRGEGRAIVRHLLAGCGRCAAELRSVIRPTVEEGAYDLVIARFAEKFRWRTEAPEEEATGCAMESIGSF